MKSLAKTIAVLLLLVAIGTIVNTLTHPSRQLAVEGIPPMSLERDAIVPRLQRAIQLKTLSHDDNRLFDTQSFKDLHAHIFSSFPLIAQQLEVEVVNEMSLLFFWPGSDDSLKPVALLNHLDVVPVQSNTLDRWKAAPFSGDIIDGRIYGRGTLDVKSGAMASLEAIELLLAGGFQPRRSIYIALGHDEETGGAAGARAIVERLKQRNVELEFVLDEGGAIVTNAIPGISNKIAMIGVAEKGYISLTLTVETASGHSSQPPKEMAIGILSRALVRIEDQPFPSRLSDPVRLNLEYLASELPAPLKWVATNLWLFKPLILAAFEGDPALGSLVRTTAAITLFNSGIKDNVLPTTAEATVNFRILPGETRHSVMARIVQVVGDERVKIDYLAGFESNPSPVSDYRGLGFQLIQKTVSETFNQQGAVVYSTPFLLMGGTDSRHYKSIAKNIYRFSPIDIQVAELPSIHGINESIRVQNYLDMVRFYHRFIGNLNQPFEPDAAISSAD